MTSTSTTRGGAERSAPPHPRRRFGGALTQRPTSTQWAAWAFLLPIAIYLVVFYAYPLYKNVDLSIRNYTVESFVQGGANFTGLANYKTVVSNPTFLPALEHTAIFTGCSLLFQFAIGMALALFFYQHFRLSSTLRALFLVPWLLPLIVSGSVWAWMLDSTAGVINWVLSLVGIAPVDWLTSPHWALISVTIANIWIGIPFNLVLLYSGLQNISGDVLEAAALDGAGPWKRFWNVTFPLLRPVAAITLLLGLVYTVKVFDLIWIMTRGGPANASQTLATWAYQQAFGNLLPSFDTGAAIGNILIVIALAFGLIYVGVQRRLEI